MDNLNQRGLEWLLANHKGPVSAFGGKVACILDQALGGIHNLNRGRLERVLWDSKDLIIFRYSAGFASFDNDWLTRLLVLCHDESVRLEIQPGGNINIILLFSPRELEGDLYHRHPTLEESVKKIREEIYGK